MPSNTIFAPTGLNQFQSNNVNFLARGVTGTVPAGLIAGIDLKMDDDMLITGCQMSTKGAAFGDYVNLRVVDVDNVMGFGAGAILNQFCDKWYLMGDGSANGTQQIFIQVPYPAKLSAGLYLRADYHSTGVTTVQVNINYLLHKVLY